MAYIGSPAAPTIATVSDDTITSAKIDSTSTGMTFADLTVDTNTLVVDETNNRVGIGTSSPVTTLDVGGTIYSSGVIRNTNGGSVSVPSIQPGNDNDTGIYHPATNTIGFSTVGTERMRINSSGIVTKPNHPLFSGYQSGSNTGATGGSTDYLIVCNGSFVNNGSHYNTSTGVFTCPVDGIYIVHAYAMSITASADGVFYATRLRLYKNGGGTGNYAYNYGDGYRHVSGNWAINCSANDTLGVMSNDSLGGYNWIIIQLVG